MNSCGPIKTLFFILLAYCCWSVVFSGFLVVFFFFFKKKVELGLTCCWHGPRGKGLPGPKVLLDSWSWHSAGRTFFIYICTTIFSHSCICLAHLVKFGSCHQNWAVLSDKCFAWSLQTLERPQTIFQENYWKFEAGRSRLNVTNRRAARTIAQDEYSIPRLARIAPTHATLLSSLQSDRQTLLVWHSGDCTCSWQRPLKNPWVQQASSEQAETKSKRRKCSMQALTVFIEMLPNIAEVGQENGRRL